MITNRGKQARALFISGALKIFQPSNAERKNLIVKRMKKMDTSDHSEPNDKEDGMDMANTANSIKKSKAIGITIATGLLFFVTLHVGGSSFGSSDATTSSPQSLMRRRAQQQQQEIEENTEVTAISLIGERHSGTNWITDHLEK